MAVGQELTALSASSISPSELTELRPVVGQPPLRIHLLEIMRRRDLIWAIASSDLRARNMDTALGSIWYLMNPLLQAAIYLLVFGIFLGARRGVDNYVAFLTVGILIFNYTGKSLQNGANTIILNRQLVQSISFPRPVLPLASVVSETVAMLPALGTMALVLVATGEQLHATALLVLPALLLQAAFNAGLALFVARLTFHIRDVQQLLPYVTRMWLYVSGIFYTVEVIPEGWPRQVFRLNPLQSIITLNRSLLLEGRLDTQALGATTVWAATALLLGFAFFHARESEYGHA